MKPNKEEKNKVPPPPEPEFFDEPQGFIRRRHFKDLLRSRRMVLLLVLIFSIVLMLFFFLSRKVEQRGPNFPKEEKRSFVTPRSIDQAIETSAKEEKKVLPQREGREDSTRKKRNYATNIAVFVYHEKEEKQSPYERKEREKEKLLGLPSGTKIPALLSNRVFSFNIAAPVLAIVPKDFSWKGEVVIPKDSKFLGEASVLKSLDRINVTFELLIFPDGREMRVRAMALSEDGSAGIKGKVEKHRDVRALKAIGETLLAGSTLFLGGRRTDPYSLEDQLRLNLAQNLTSEAQQDLRQVRVEQSVTAEAYTPIQVILLEAI